MTYPSTFEAEVKELRLQLLSAQGQAAELQDEVARLREALDAIPDRVDIYRAIKASKVRRHGDIARVVHDILDPIARAALEGKA